MNQSLEYEIDAAMEQILETGLFSSLCTIQAPDGVIGASGAPSGVYANVTGLVGLACLDAPEHLTSASGSEGKTSASVISKTARLVHLDAFYSQLSPQTNWGDVGWIAIITGPTGTVTTYDITSADADSEQITTVLRLQRARA